MDGTLRLALVVATLAVLGEAGHVVLDQLNLDLAHHFFHILFPLVAFVVFAVFAARDIQRHGWPTFSWHLSASSTTTGRKG
jgi:hypothetical protein